MLVSVGARNCSLILEKKSFNDKKLSSSAVGWKQGSSGAT